MPVKKNSQTASANIKHPKTASAGTRPRRDRHRRRAHRYKNESAAQMRKAVVVMMAASAVCARQNRKVPIQPASSKIAVNNFLRRLPVKTSHPPSRSSNSLSISLYTGFSFFTETMIQTTLSNQNRNGGRHDNPMDGVFIIVNIFKLYDIISLKKSQSAVCTVFSAKFCAKGRTGSFRLRLRPICGTLNSLGSQT